MKIRWQDIRTLDKSYAQDIIQTIYLVSLLITIGSGLYSMVEEGFTFFAFVRGLIVIVFGGILCRLLAEAAQVLFRIEKHLSTIAANSKNDLPVVDPEATEDQQP